MPTTTPTILDQISAEKTKISERLARLDTDRAKIATQLTDLETAERVLTRVSWAPPGRKPRAASVVEVRRPCCARPTRTAAKSSHEQVSGTQTQRTKSRRARIGPGYRQDPTRTLHGVPKRSPEPRRHCGTAPYPCRTYRGARRQAVCDVARNRAGTRGSLNSGSKTNRGAVYLAGERGLCGRQLRN